MLKLVTQFDSKESKISLATPTCGCCCCCCCCCLISTIIVPVVSARSFAGVWAIDEEKTVKLYPQGISQKGIITETGKDKLAMVLFVLLSFLSAVVIASLVFLAVFLRDLDIMIGLIALGVSGGLYWYIFSCLLERGYLAKRIVIRNIITLLIWAALAAGELYVGIFLLLNAPILYLILIIAAVIAAITLIVRD